MSFRPFIRGVLITLCILSVICTTYLYFYPALQGCAFPSPTIYGPGTPKDTTKKYLWPLGTNNKPNASPPFRLLVLADPQLEGDSSLPAPEDGFRARIKRRWEALLEPANSLAEWLVTTREELRNWAVEDIPNTFRATRKRIDLFGNDYYLAHIYRTLQWWTQPSHVTVLGDLIGSQWVTDEEFNWRGWRYWNRVFRGSSKAQPPTRADGSHGSVVNQSELDEKSWSHRLINVAGNHDIGYAGDISSTRISRFETVFGPPNWDVRFEYPRDHLPRNASSTPSLHLIVLNSLNLDTPALASHLQTTDYAFLNKVIASRSRPVEDRSSFTLLLTHLPLYKAEGVCVDPPHFQFYEFDDPEERFKSGGLQEQNHLSEHVSTQAVLQGLYGMSGDINTAAQGQGRNGLILTGHDHEGCDTWHHVPTGPAIERRQINTAAITKGGWLSIPWSQREQNVTETGIREITLRSMMGEYGGNAGLLSLWYDSDIGEWDYRIEMCLFGTQHIWWGVHVLDIVTLSVLLLWLLYAAKIGAGPERVLLVPVEKLEIPAAGENARS